MMSLNKPESSLLEQGFIQISPDNIQDIYHLLHQKLCGKTIYRSIWTGEGEDLRIPDLSKINTDDECFSIAKAGILFGKDGVTLEHEGSLYIGINIELGRRGRKANADLFWDTEDTSRNFIRDKPIHEIQMVEHEDKTCLHIIHRFSNDDNVQHHLLRITS